MKSGSMFAGLLAYKDQYYYNQMSEMMIYTPTGDYKLELFAGIVADGNYEFIRFNFADDADFLDYIDGLKSKSTFISHVDVQSSDQIVALCTCSYEFNNARYALFGRLVPQ